MDTLLKRFYLLMVLLIFGGIFLGLITLYIPLRQSFAREARSSFERAFDLRGREAAYMVENFKNDMVALGSRSAIREAKGAYLLGDLDLDGLREYVQPRFADGAQVIPYLVQARRYSPKGELVARYGYEDLLSDFSIDGPDILLLVDLLGPGTGYFLSITRALFLGEVLVGYDHGIFQGNMLVSNSEPEIAGLSLGSRGEHVDEGFSRRFPLDDRIELRGTRNSQSYERGRTEALWLMGVYTFSMVALFSILGYFMVLTLIRKTLGSYVEANRELERANEAKALLLKEVHHRIKNNMNTVASLLELQSSMIEDEVASEALLKAVQRLQSMTLLYDRLYRKDDVQELSISLYLNSLVHEILGIFPQPSQIHLVVDLEDLSLSPRILSPLGIIVNELITNAMKYAYPHRTEGNLILSGTVTDGEYTLVLQDDGPGISEKSKAEPHKKSFGLELVHILVRQLKAELHYENANPGTRWVIRVPLDLPGTP